MRLQWVLTTLLLLGGCRVARASELVAGPEVSVQPSAGTSTDIAHLDATRIVVTFVDGAAGGPGRVGVLTVMPDGTIQPGDLPIPFAGAVRETSIVALSSTEIVIVYRESASPFAVQAVYATVAGTTVTLSGSDLVAASTSTATNRTIDVSGVDGGHAVVAYRTSTGTLEARVGFVDRSGPPDLVFTGGTSVLETATTSTSISVTQFDATRVAFAWGISATNGGRARLAQIDTVATHDFSSLGAAIPFFASAVTLTSITRVSARQLAVGFLDASGVPRAALLANDSALVLTNVQVIGVGPPGSTTMAAQSLDSTRVVLAFDDGGVSQKHAVGIVIRVGGDTLKGCSPFSVLNRAPGGTPPTVASLTATQVDINRLVFAYEDRFASGLPTVRTASAVDSLLFLTGFETGTTGEGIQFGTGSAAVKDGSAEPGSGSWVLRQAAGGAPNATTLFANGANGQDCEQIAHFGLRFSMKKVAPGTVGGPIVSFRGNANATPQWELRLEPSTGRLAATQIAAIGLTGEVGVTDVADAALHRIYVSYAAHAGGRLRVYVDEVLEIDTTHSVTGLGIDGVQVMAPEVTLYDDFAATDGLDRPPRGQIIAIRPDGPGAADGSLTKWDTPPMFADHTALVNEETPSAANFVEDALGGVNDDELFSLANDPAYAGQARIAVKAMFLMERGPGGGSGVGHNIALREAGAAITSIGSLDGSISTSPSIFTFNWTVAPSGTSWTPAGVDGLLLGAHHSNGSTQASFVHWLAAMVDHGGVDVTPTSIAVAYFRANGVRSGIRLEGQLAPDAPHATFHVLRETSPGVLARISDSPLEPSAVDRRFEFLDESVDDREYTYWIESASGERIGPVSARPAEAAGCQTTGSGGGEILAIAAIFCVAWRRRSTRGARFV